MSVCSDENIGLCRSALSSEGLQFFCPQSKSRG